MSISSCRLLGFSSSSINSPQNTQTQLLPFLQRKATRCWKENWQELTMLWQCQFLKKFPYGESNVVINQFISLRILSLGRKSRKEISGMALYLCSCIGEKPHCSYSTYEQINWTTSQVNWNSFIEVMKQQLCWNFVCIKFVCAKERAKHLCSFKQHRIFSPDSSPKKSS